MTNEMMEITVDMGAAVRQVMADGTSREWKVVDIEGVDPSKCRGFVHSGDEWTFRGTKFILQREGEDDLVITGSDFIASQKGPAMFKVSQSATSRTR